MKDHVKYGSAIIALVIISIGTFFAKVPNILTQIHDRARLTAAVVSSIVPTPIPSSGIVPISVPSNERNDFAIVSDLNQQLSTGLSAYISAPVASQQSLADDLTAIAVRRKAPALDLMRINPSLFLFVAIQSSIWSKLPPAAQTNVEKFQNVAGSVGVLSIDNFTNSQNSRQTYTLNLLGTSYFLFPTEELDIESGTTILSPAYMLDNQIAFDSGPSNTQLSIRPPYTTIPGATGVQRLLVILIKTNSGDTEPLSASQARDAVFNGQFPKFMQEQSYGKVSFTGDVFGLRTRSYT